MFFVFKAVEPKDLRNQSIFSWTLTRDALIGVFAQLQLSRAMPVTGQGKTLSGNPAHLVLRKPHFKHDLGSGTLDSTNMTWEPFQGPNQILSMACVGHLPDWYKDGLVC